MSKLRWCTGDTDATITSSRVGAPQYPRLHILMICRRYRIALLGSVAEDPILRCYGRYRVRHRHVRCSLLPNTPRPLMTPKAGDAQVRHLQLPHRLPRQEDSSHPSEDVAGERRQLSRAAIFHALAEAPPDGRPLSASYHPGCYRPGEDITISLYFSTKLTLTRSKYPLATPSSARSTPASVSSSARNCSPLQAPTFSWVLMGSKYLPIQAVVTMNFGSYTPGLN